MSITDSASRQYVAHPPFWGAKMARRTAAAWSNPASKAKFYLIAVAGILAFSAVSGMVYNSLARRMRGPDAEIFDDVFRYGGVLLLLGGFAVYYKLSQGRKIRISVTGEGVSVNTRRDDFYPFSTATLGTWGVTGGMTMGTTLHLQCGQHRFVLGGRDYRVGAGTRLDAPDAGYGLPIDVDAWVSASDFGEIVDMAARHGRLEIRQPAPGDPIRCLLFPNPVLVQRMGTFAFGERRRLLQSISQPSVAIDIDAQTVRVTDMSTNAVIASASLAEVTATPVTYAPSSRYWFPTPQYVLSDLMTTHLSTMPGMVVSVSGLQPLTIGCRDSSGFTARFSWQGDAPVENDIAAYTISGPDWLMLVDKFGLTAWLDG